MNQMLGKQSICFEQPAYVLSSASVVGKKEGEGPLKDYFDKIHEDPALGEENWETAESAMQKEALELAVQKAGLQNSQLRLIFSGDLQAQSVASSFGLQGFALRWGKLWAWQLCLCRVAMPTIRRL